MLKFGKSIFIYLGVSCVGMIVLQELYQASRHYNRHVSLAQLQARDTFNRSHKRTTKSEKLRPDRKPEAVKMTTTTQTPDARLHDRSTQAPQSQGDVTANSTVSDQQEVNQKELDDYRDQYEFEKSRLMTSPFIYNALKERLKIQNAIYQTSVKKIYPFVQQVSSHNSFKQCLYTRCEFVNNISEAEAVMFSASSVRGNPMPLQNRTKNQRWILYTYDPAIKNYGLGRDEVRSNFNWTMTYQTDADYPLIFGQLQRRKLPDKDYRKIFSQKKNHTAWFVSHCNTWGKRETYIERMSKLVPVDIFGGCSDRKCGVIHYRSSDSTLCLPMLTNHYKFYLAFENSFCKDYLTEKFFKLFADVDVIPVVRGGFDYKKYLPTGIFVDAADFKSPEDLAKHLKELGSNETEYVNMLKRKNRWVERGSTSLVCNICEALHTARDRPSYIPDLEAKFNGKPSYCWEPKDLGDVS